VKTILCLTAVALLMVTTPAISDDKPAAKPAGMSLRLELFVTDMEKSIDFYTKVLGFERLKGSLNYVPVRSGSVVIGLGPAKGLPKDHHFNPEVQSARRGLGAELVLEVDDIEAYFQKVKDSGHKILSPLRKRPWGATDFRIADPDGYYLRITSR
jgi:lactoylglutathione lyase